MYKLIIFDLDGTLADTLEDLADAVNYALTKNGYSAHPTASFNHFVGNGVPKLIERSLPKEALTDKIKKAVMSDFTYYYNEHSMDKTKAYDGISELLDTLKKNNVLTAVATNKSDEFVSLILETLFPQHVFDKAQGGTDYLPKKPNPAVVEKILEDLHVKKEECIFAGDSDVDIYTAKNAGVTSIGCIWGFRGIDELSKAGADFLVFEPSQILKILN